MIVDAAYNRQKVEAWGRELLADPFDALGLLAVLLQGVPHTGHQGALLTRFEALSPFERAGLVDELRDALDKTLGGVFGRYVAAARQAAELAKDFDACDVHED